MKSSIHPRQAERLASLRRYEILETGREADFDEIVELAMHACDMPVCLISLVDEHREWIKAEVGWGGRQLPIISSIGAHAILETGFVEIPDTHEDSRTADNELCLGETGLRFYAGFPLVGDAGLAIGMLCVFDRSPRQLGTEQKRSLEILANLVMRGLDLRVEARREGALRKEMNHRIKNSLQAVAIYLRMGKRDLERGRNASDAFDEVARRVEAVAALHEALQKTSRRQKLRLDKYLERIVGYMSDAAPPNVEISYRADVCETDSDTASNLGVIVTECIANALKHAFPDGQTGRVRIELACDDNQIYLICADNGEGLEGADTDKRRKSGLGTSVVDAAARHIGATIERTASSSGFRMELLVHLSWHRPARDETG